MTRTTLMVILSAFLAIGLVAGCESGGDEAEKKPAKEKQKAPEDKEVSGEKDDEPEPDEPDEPGEVDTPEEGPDADEPAAEDGAEPGEVDGKTIVKIDAAAETTCAQISDGTVRCWGSNDHGALGIGSDVADSPFAQTVALTDVEELFFNKGYGASSAYGSLDQSTGCARVKGGAVHCWGGNQGLYGDGESKGSNTPIEVALLKDIKMTAHGEGAGCAIAADGKVLCFGSKAFGVLGRELTEEDKWTAKAGPVKTIEKATKAGCGQNHSCALVEGGELYCWGYGHGEGDPVKIEGITGATDLALGGSDTCVIVDGVAQCGYGPDLKPVEGTADLTQISRTTGTTCGVTKAGDVLCWGANYWGEVGDGTRREERAAAIKVELPPAKQVDVGVTHACALLQDGRVMCWGANRRGQLGDGTLDDQFKPVVAKYILRDAPKEAIDAVPNMLPAEVPAWPAALPEGCAATAEPAETTFKIHTAFAQRTTTELGTDNYSLRLANYPFEWDAWQEKPRGEQIMFIAKLVHREEIDDENGEKKKIDKQLIRGTYKPEWRGLMEVEGRIHNKVTYPAFAEGSLVVTHIGREYICGHFDLTPRDVPALKARFAAKLQNPMTEDEFSQAVKLMEQLEAAQGTPAEGTPAEGAEGTPVEGAEGTPAEGAEGTPAEGTPAEGTPAEGTPAEVAPVEPPVPEKKEATAEDVKAFCDGWKDSVDKFGDKCKPLGKRLGRHFRAKELTWADLEKHPAEMKACKKAEKAMAGCADEKAVADALKLLK